MLPLSMLSVRVGHHSGCSCLGLLVNCDRHFLSSDRERTRITHPTCRTPFGWLLAKHDGKLKALSGERRDALERAKSRWVASVDGLIVCSKHVPAARQFIYRQLQSILVISNACVASSPGARHIRTLSEDTDVLNPDTN
jgi:hypothetical protein